MTNNLYIPLKHRAVIAISGADSEKFLQGLITNDIKKAESSAIYALMLTPQGKFLYEFFIVKKDDEYLIDCSAADKDEILKKLKMYKLRSDVILTDLSDKYESVAIIGDGVFDAIGDAPHKAGSTKPFCKGVAYIDPRSEKLFGRSFIEIENEYQSFKAYEFSEGFIDDYEQARIEAGIADGDNDMEKEGSFPLDFAMNDIGAIDYKKGCYVGQEVTTRVHHRGKIRKRPYMVTADSPLPPKGTEVTSNGEKIGIMLSSNKNIGLALLQSEKVAKENNAYKVGSVNIKLRT